MKKTFGMVIVVLLMAAPARAQVITIEAIQAATKKILNAIDLKIQRLQTNTIWLQNAQKEIENVLSKLKLEEIAGWVDKQRKLYDDYFQELWKVKTIISGYDKLRTIAGLQSRIVNEYRKSIGLLRSDGHFTVGEITHMQQVYESILASSAKNLDRIFTVAESFTVQMTDENRIAIIDETATAMQQHYNDLRAFTNQNMLLSLQRSTDLKDAQTIKQLYGLQ